MFPPAQPEILHAAPRFVVAVKPAGMLTVPGKGQEKQDCLVARVRSMFPGASGPMIVHRLDMETSGVVVLALDRESQRDLSAQFERRDVEKAYVALLAGDLPADEGVVDLPLRPDLCRRPHQVPDWARGRTAITRFRVLGREIDRTRVLFNPFTGRTHQIRVHAADRRGLGHPILGDGLYGDATTAPRLMLHARTIAFREPGGPRRVEFTSESPF